MRNLIKAKTAKLGNKLASIRNAYLHPQNTISGLRLQYKLVEESNPKLFKLLSVASTEISAVMSLPDYKWCTKNTTREGIEKSIQRFWHDQLQSLSHLELRKFAELTFERQAWFKRRAEEALNIAFEIICDTGFYKI